MIMMEDPDPEWGAEFRTPHFRVGQLVRHRRYGYRAVVVAVDSNCKGGEAWYQSNQTQPERGQPWYHVLVDGDSTVRYAAQTSLDADPSAEPIEHPLTPHFFNRFEDGAYVRNDEPWPS